MLSEWSKAYYIKQLGPLIGTISCICSYNLSLLLITCLFFLNIFFSWLLFLQYLFKFVALLYHCLMFLGDHSTSISIHWIILFISLLNSLIQSLFLYLFHLSVLLNSCTNSLSLISILSSLTLLYLLIYYSYHWILFSAWLGNLLLLRTPILYFPNISSNFSSGYLLILLVYMTVLTIPAVQLSSPVS